MNNNNNNNNNSNKVDDDDYNREKINFNESDNNSNKVDDDSNKVDDDKLDFIKKIHLDKNTPPCYSFTVEKNEKYLLKLLNPMDNYFYYINDKYGLKYVWWYPDEKKISIWTKNNDEDNKLNKCEKIKFEILEKLTTYVPSHIERIDFEKNIIARLIGYNGNFFKQELKNIDEINITSIYFDPDISSICIIINNKCDDKTKNKLIKEITINIYIKIYDIIVKDYKNNKIRKNSDLYIWATKFQKYYKNNCIGTIPKRQYNTTIMKKESTNEEKESTNEEKESINEEKESTNEEKESTNEGTTKQNKLITNENPKFIE